MVPPSLDDPQEIAEVASKSESTREMNRNFFIIAVPFKLIFYIIITIISEIVSIVNSIFCKPFLIFSKCY